MHQPKVPAVADGRDTTTRGVASCGEDVRAHLNGIMVHGDMYLRRRWCDAIIFSVR
jgi:hypothetical protein